MRLFAGVCLLFIITPSFCGVITPSLLKQLDEKDGSEMIAVYMVMKEQPANDVLENCSCTKRLERRRILVEYLEDLRDMSQRDILGYLEKMKREKKVKQIRSLWLGNMICMIATKGVINECAKDNNVDYIDGDEELEFTCEQHDRVPVAQSRDITWNIVKVRAPEVWGLGYTGENVIVSLIDTGVRYSHRDLADHIWTNSDEIPDNGVDDDSNGYVDDYYGYDFYWEDGNPIDDHGHGTHNAGVIAGDGTAGTQTGVAPDARIMSLKVINALFQGTESDCWEAMQYSLDNGADIVVAPLGLPHSYSPDRQQWRNMCNTLLTAGIIMTSPVGNEGGSHGAPDNVLTPADVPPPWLHPDQTLTGGLSCMITAGGTDSLDVIADFSSRGPVTWDTIAPWFDFPYDPEMGLLDPDICAPCISILSLRHDNDSTYFIHAPGTCSGTSHVGGAIALLLSKNATLSPPVIDSILEITAVDFGPVGKDSIYGSGRLDCYEAINAVSIKEERTGYPGKQHLVLNITPNPSSGHFKLHISDHPSGSQSFSLAIYDAVGRLVKEFDCANGNSRLPAEMHWDGTDDYDQKVPDGVYFAALEIDAIRVTRKLLIVR